MRGEPARTADEYRLQGEVAEYLLTTKAGLSRRDLYGEERHGFTVEDRYDVAASLRRTLSRLGRSKVRRALSIPFISAGIAAALAGLGLVAMYAALLAIAVYTASDRLPDELFEEPDPAVTRSTTKVPGMHADEVARRLAIHNEREDLRAEKIEEQRRRQERKANSQGF